MVLKPQQQFTWPYLNLFCYSNAKRAKDQSELLKIQVQLCYLHLHSYLSLCQLHAQQLIAQDFI